MMRVVILVGAALAGACRKAGPPMAPVPAMAEVGAKAREDVAPPDDAERFRAPKRTYTRMAVADATARLETHLRNGDIPWPHDSVTPAGLSKPSVWDLLEEPSTGAVHARGIGVGTRDYVLYGAARAQGPPGTLSAIPFEIAGNLADLWHALKKTIGSTGLLDFAPNGVLFATLDLEVASHEVLCRGAAQGRWRRGQRRLEKGGYMWSTGSAGILLSRDGLVCLVAFHDPIPELSPVAKGGLYLVPIELDVPGGTDSGIHFAVGRERIEWR